MTFSWKKLAQPFFCLAPMEGATDAAFRQVVISCGRPDVCFTEFVNVEGMRSPGKRFVEQGLTYEAVEQPLIAQIWGLQPENFFKAAEEVVVRGFAGVDINMACPVQKVIGKGAGGGLIKNPNLAVEIIDAVKRGVGGKIPVSVKTRIGFKEIVTEDWCGLLLDQKLDALTVHGRTVRELSKVPAHWDEIGKVVDLKKQIGVETVIIGNGDVESRVMGEELAEKYGLDGIMIGRGVFKNPWVFQQKSPKSREEKIAVLIKHLDIYQRIWGETKRFDPLKRFFKIYINGFEGAAELREQLMQLDSIEATRTVLEGELVQLSVT